MRLSVIISTYNQPAWLEKVIWGYAAQTHRDFELVIADDGSKAETGEMIARLRNESGLPIRHVWHEDNGFRKCRILNQAILEAQTDYLVFTDGDCIPRRDFLAQHVANAEPGCMLSGTTLRLPMDVSQKITKADILAGHATNFRWLCAQGFPWSFKLLRRSVGARFARLMDRMTTKFNWLGCHASTWKKALLSVNGFDERFEYGWEDFELGERLKNCGLHGKCVRYQAICVHLDHSRGYVREESKARNKEMYQLTRNNHLTWTPYGIEKQAAPLQLLAAA